MLAIGRRFGEIISLILPCGRTVEIKICALAESYVRIGIEAPKDIKIWRGKYEPESKGNDGDSGSTITSSSDSGDDGEDTVYGNSDNG